jgi:adenosylmethionine-8-amino-7-oxononanoate aminotransferase
MVPIVRGEGAWLIDADGNRYLDGISSWWTNLFGHANPRIAAALADQARTLEHVIFAGFTHEPAIAGRGAGAHHAAGLDRVFLPTTVRRRSKWR